MENNNNNAGGIIREENIEIEQVSDFVVNLNDGSKIKGKNVNEGLECSTDFENENLNRKLNLTWDLISKIKNRKDDNKPTDITTSICHFKNGDKLHINISSQYLLMDTVFGSISIPFYCIKDMSIKTLKGGGGNKRPMINANLLAYFPLNNIDDNKQFSDEFGNSGVAMGNPVVKDYCIEFNGQSNVEIKHPSNKSSFSVFVWGKSKSDTWNNHGWIGEARGQSGFIFHPDKNTSNLRYFLVDKNGSYTNIGYVTPKIKEWNQYGIIYNSKEKKGYCVLNGEIIHETVVNISRSKQDSLTVSIGLDRCEYNVRYGKGYQSCYSYFDDALTEDDVLALYEYETNIVSYN
eukprot:TRINITY_DN12556_c0_g1_i1.p1 TRINITY_DN12556_c0_g1~~TRINITY_DN12556_c0_g1_i1.p1  ORF type:complete len:348 (-),score=106.07 TRINITY_DN12556_c0_g1_i1:82-1125(-)